MRRLYRAGRRQAGAVMPDPGGAVRRPRGGDHGGPGGQRSSPPGAGGVHPPRRVPVRLLHARTDHVGGRVAGRGASGQRRGHPRVHERQHLPLRRLLQHRRRDPRGRRARGCVAMRPFEYIRATDPAQAMATVTADPAADYLAGGTTELDLVLKDGILSPERLVDVTRLPLKGITANAAAIRVGATTTMEELAADRTVSGRLPFVRDALLDSASVQLRNMATIGGNLLQRTRCRYFRDPAVEACNKRRPGTGCAAVTGAGRMHAILGASGNCIALHASDLAVPLVALDTIVHILGPGGVRRVPLTEFYLEPGDTPDIENVLAHGELITEIEIPLLPQDARSTYLKVRDRTSYEFALTSAGVAVVVEDGVIRDARVGLGGVGPGPGGAWGAQRALRDAPGTGATVRAAGPAAVLGPLTVPRPRVQIELAEPALV